MEKTGPYELLKKLNEIINVVLGNHDYKNHVPELLKYVNSVAGMVNCKGFILTYCPIHYSQLEHRYSRNIHGHIHANSLYDDRYVNVCCEVIDYKPVLISELYKPEETYCKKEKWECYEIHTVQARIVRCNYQCQECKLHQQSKK